MSEEGRGPLTENGVLGRNGVLAHALVEEACPAVTESATTRGQETAEDIVSAIASDTRCARQTLAKDLLKALEIYSARKQKTDLFEEDFITGFNITVFSLTSNALWFAKTEREISS